jgi:hypothetical protein
MPLAGGPARVGDREYESGRGRNILSFLPVLKWFIRRPWCPAIHNLERIQTLLFRFRSRSLSKCGIGGQRSPGAPRGNDGRVVRPRSGAGSGC